MTLISRASSCIISIPYAKEKAIPSRAARKDVLADVGLNLNLKTELQVFCCKAYVQHHFQKED